MNNRLRHVRVRASSLFRPHIGGLFRYYFRSKGVLKVALQLGGLYVVKGYIQYFSQDDPTRRTRMSYIEIPVRTHFMLDIGKYYLFSNIGFYYERLLDIDEEEAAEITGESRVYYFLEEVDRKQGLGLHIGFGAGIDLVLGRFEAEFALSQGMQNIFRVNSLVSPRPIQTNHTVWLLSITYLHKLWKSAANRP